MWRTFLAHHRRIQWQYKASDWNTGLLHVHKLLEILRCRNVWWTEHCSLRSWLIRCRCSRYGVLMQCYGRTDGQGESKYSRTPLIRTLVIRIGLALQANIFLLQLYWMFLWLKIFPPIVKY